jgi:hypothetical protein
VIKRGGSREADVESVGLLMLGRPEMGVELIEDGVGLRS